MRHRKSINLIPDNVDPKSLHDYAGVTLDTLRQWDILGGKCMKCGHEAWLNRQALEQQHGNHYLMTLQKRLCCTKCGSKGECKFVVGSMSRD